MGNFTLSKGSLESKCGTCCSFKGFVMLVAMMLMTASSAMAEVIDGLRYSLNAGTKTATLLRTTDGYSGNIVVPEKVKGSDGIDYTVVAFGDECFSECSGLTSITIPSSVTSLRKNCFKNCRGLTSITIPSSATSLGEGCFYGCSGLTSIKIPSSVTSFGEGCFYFCSRLTSINIPSAVTSLENSCFNGCSGLTSITIPSSVTSLGTYCFASCRGLTSITIPSSVTSLGIGCFDGCSGLTSITIPSSVTSLGKWCFNYCRGLTSITIPSSVTSLGEYCFNGCSGLISINIPSSVTSLANRCFYGCSGLTSITIPSSVTYLGNSCFSDCSSLESLYFKGYVPDGIKYASIPTACIIYVPSKFLQKYKEVLGSAYDYETWNPDGTGGDTNPETPCAIPSVSYDSGKLKFACETAGVKYHYTITDTDVISDILDENGEVSLSAAYQISVYATADGYTASEMAKATLYWLNANLDTGTNINQVKTRGVVVSAHDGIISLSGLDDGEVVKFFAVDGKYLGSTVTSNGTASYAASESLVIAKVGKDSIKILMK